MSGDSRGDLTEYRVDIYRGDGVAVRVTHMPTGVVATSSDQPSELLNREAAMAEVRRRVAEHPDFDPAWKVSE